MLLSEWLRREKIRRYQFAAMIGVSNGTISFLCNGDKWLSRQTARAIERETKGEVTAADFVHLGD